MHALRLLPLALLLAAGGATARDCRHQQAHDLALDLAGVERLEIELGAHDLDLAGVDGASAGTVAAKACATDPELLAHLGIAQSREGATLVLKIGHLAEQHSTMVLFGSHYEYVTARVEIPAGLPVRLRVGSGDARIDNVAALDLDVGSGDVHIERLAGALLAEVGSGDLVAADVGALTLHSVGSGDVTLRRVRGPVEVGSIGSGDLGLREVDGDVQIRSIGSGDAVVQGVRGSVTLGSLGSGDLVVRDASGDLTVERRGSGDVRHSGIGGTLSLPRER